MKKTLSLLLVVVMCMSLFCTFTISASAAMVKLPEYYYENLLDSDETLLSELKYDGTNAPVGEALSVGDIIRISKAANSMFVGSLRVLYNASDKNSFPYANYNSTGASVVYSWQQTNMAYEGEVEGVVLDTELIRFSYGPYVEPVGDTPGSRLDMQNVTDEVTVLVCDLANEDEPVRVGNIMDLVARHDGNEGSRFIMCKNGYYAGTMFVYVD